MKSMKLIGLNLLILSLTMLIQIQAKTATGPYGLSKQIIINDESLRNSVTLLISAVNQEKLADFLDSRSFKIEAIFPDGGKELSSNGEIKTFISADSKEELSEKTVSIQIIRADLDENAIGVNLLVESLINTPPVDPTWEEYTSPTDFQQIKLYHKGSDPSGRIVGSYWYRDCWLCFWTWDKYEYVEPGYSAPDYCRDGAYKIRIRVLAVDHSTATYIVGFYLNCN